MEIAAASRKWRSPVITYEGENYPARAQKGWVDSDTCNFAELFFSNERVRLDYAGHVWSLFLILNFSNRIGENWNFWLKGNMKISDSIFLLGL